MVWVKSAERIHQVVESFGAANSAREDAFLYHKFGRYQNAFPEKPYFLLSHCAHILFSLWRIEEEGNGNLYGGAARPTAFLAGLDFEKLRYTDYKRRLLHADSLEDHWRNETQWFTFWIQVLEHLDPAGAALYKEFSGRILALATESCVLQDKRLRQNHRALCHFMKSDTVGHALRRTLSVLDELMQGIVRCAAGLDPRTHVREQITLLIGLLQDIRRTVVHQAPVKGPYVPSRAARWRPPFGLASLFWGRTQGTLTLVPKREGGDIICSYNFTFGATSRRRSWVRAVSSLAGTYDQELFATWSYETGEYLEDPGRFPDARACWGLQHDEISRLETLAQLIDALLDTLEFCPQCVSLIEEVRSVSRNGSAKWRPVDLPWTYIRRLDQLLDRLTHARQEVEMVSTHSPAQTNVPALKSAPEAAIGEADSVEPEDRGNIVVSTGSEHEEQPSAPVDPPESPSDGSSDIADAAARPETLLLCLPTESVSVDSSPVASGPLLITDEMVPPPEAEIVLHSAATAVSISKLTEPNAHGNEAPPVVEGSDGESPMLNPAGGSDGSVPSELTPQRMQSQPESETASPSASVSGADQVTAPTIPDTPRVRRPRKTRPASNVADTADSAKRSRPAKRTRSKKTAETANVAVPEDVSGQRSELPQDQDNRAGDAAPQAVEPAPMMIIPEPLAACDGMRDSHPAPNEVSLPESRELSDPKTSESPVQATTQAGKPSRSRSRSAASRTTEPASEAPGTTGRGKRPRRTRSTKPVAATDGMAEIPVSVEVPDESSGGQPQPDSPAPNTESREAEPVLAQAGEQPPAASQNEQEVPLASDEPLLAPEKSDVPASVDEPSPTVKRAGRPKRSVTKTATPRKPRTIRSKAKAAGTADSPAPDSTEQAGGRKPRRTAGRKAASVTTKQAAPSVADQTDPEDRAGDARSGPSEPVGFEESQRDGSAICVQLPKAAGPGKPRVRRKQADTESSGVPSGQARRARTALVSCGGPSSWSSGSLAD